MELIFAQPFSVNKFRECHRAIRDLGKRLSYPEASSVLIAAREQQMTSELATYASLSAVRERLARINRRISDHMP